MTIYGLVATDDNRPIPRPPPTHPGSHIHYIYQRHNHSVPQYTTVYHSISQYTTVYDSIPVWC